MIHGIDHTTREMWRLTKEMSYWERKARTNHRIGLVVKTILVALAAAVALAVIL